MLEELQDIVTGLGDAQETLVSLNPRHLSWLVTHDIDILSEVPPDPKYQTRTGSLRVPAAFLRQAVAHLQRAKESPPKAQATMTTPPAPSPEVPPSPVEDSPKETTDDSEASNAEPEPSKPRQTKKVVRRG